MKLLWKVLCIVLFIISSNVWSMDAAVKQKYPNRLLTEDYGILKESDLATNVERVNSASFSEKGSHGLNYWQCFSRDHISVKFEDLGYSTEDHGWADTLANMEFSIWIKPGVFHEYAMRRVWLVKDSIKDFNHWHRLMKSEKYVCLNGYFINREEEVRQGKKVIVYGWIFNKIKTKKGCASYFDGDCFLRGVG